MENQYAAEVVVGITDRGNAVFYDVVDIQPTQFTTIKEEPSPNVTTNKSPDIAYESSFEDRVPQQATVVKENVRYSSRLRDPDRRENQRRKQVCLAEREDLFGDGVYLKKNLRLPW